MHNVIGLLDQVFVSGCRFALAVFLARQLGPDAFGLYSTFAVGLAFLLGVQAPLLLTPLYQIGFRKDFNTKDLIINLLYFNFIFIFISCLLLVLLFIVFGKQDLLLLSSFVCYVIVSLKVEIVRKTLLFKKKDLHCLVFDSTFYLLVASCIYYLFVYSFLSLEIFFGIFIIPAVVVFLVTTFGIYIYRSRLNNNKIFLEVLKVGKPFVFGSVTSFISGHYFILIMAFFIGYASVGGFNAMKTLVGPAVILIMTTDFLVYRNSAKILEERSSLNCAKNNLNAQIKPYYLAFIVCLFIVTFWHKEIVMLTYGDEYFKYSYLLPLLLLTVGVQLVSKHLALGLRLSQKLIVIQDSSFLTMYSSLLLMPILIYFFNIQGAFFGLLIQQTLLLVFYLVEIEGRHRVFSIPIWFRSNHK
jgi:O-antigen/teichoic acid export membrane protein